jgi:predicted phosphodiesterase
MRYVVISDIHSNLESLSMFVSSILPRLRPDKIICLGDIVGYNADPAACMEIVMDELAAFTIRGNHDRAVAFDDFTYFSEKALAAGKWTRKQLNYSRLDRLKKLAQGPLGIDSAFTVCHGAATDEDKYILTKQHAEEEFDWLKKNNSRILFFGHTHLQKIYCMKEKSREITTPNQTSVDIEPGSFYLINPGSIGQPRDRNPKAGFAVFDSESMNVQVMRYAYSFQNTQRKILQTHMPYAEDLAARLSFGI